MTVRRNISQEVEKKAVDSMIRPAEDYKIVTGTEKERTGVHLLFEQYQSRTESNLLNRLKVLGWSRSVLEMLESKGFIEKADWKIDQTHYIRRLFLK
jgi:hypothetical protein